MNVNLHIERLVLEGFPLSGRDPARVEAAVRTELARLLVDDSAFGSTVASAAVRSVQGAPLPVSAIESPPRLGAAIAQSLYGVVAK